MDSAQTVAPGRLTQALIVVSKVVGVLLLGIFVLVLVLMWSCEAPSDEALSKRFQRHRSELETLARMSQEDTEVIRVADGFTRIKNDWNWPRPESKWGITRDRWDEYRRLFREIGLSAGLEKDEVGNVYFIAHTEGFATHGATKGFVHCVSTTGDFDKSFLPCAEQRDEGQFGSQSAKGHSYRKLSQNWYIFETWD